jgi:ornithine--oxo-acid transaminase
MRSSSELIDLERRYGAHNYDPLEVVLVRGEGLWVFDVEGRRYLDCLSAYSAVNQGHAHPRILRALTEQAARLPLTSRSFFNDQLGLLYRELCGLTGYSRMLPMNTGAEAVETAVKAARKWAHRAKGVPRDRAQIIVCEGNFHGRTISTVSMSSDVLYREDFGPFTPGFVLVPYGDAREIEKAITARTAAVLLEPIQGEAGVIVPPPGYLSRIAAICRERRVLFMLDEIQTGLGRTGALFAYQHEADARPDVLILGKALGGGFYPVSAVLSGDEVLGLFEPGQHGSTFGGNPLAAAVARESIRVLIEEGLIENAASLGTYFQEQLSEIPSPLIREVRGRGLLIGVELTPEAGGARRYCEALQREGILCKDTHSSVIRFAPPLVVDRGTIDWALPAIRRVLSVPAREAQGERG